MKETQMPNLEDVITDSVNDAVADSELEVETPEVVTEEPVEEASEPAAEEPATEETSINDASAEVSSPAAGKTEEEPQDEFAKLAGVSQVGFGGRENRIPYSRVKKITEKAVSDLAEAALGRKLTAGEKAVAVVKAHVAQIPELTAKVTDYESRLETVGQFEQVMANDPQKFLTMLAKIPAYSEFFEFVQKAVEAAERPAPAQTAVPEQEAPATDGMPEPDEELVDGTKVYSMEGLKKLLAWNASQVESRVTNNYETKLKQIEDRYSPIQKDWEEQRRIQTALPIIKKQIEEARKWPLFNESEQEILAALQADQRISLEGAYRQVVFPKLVAERNTMRQSVLKEVAADPAATSVPNRVATKPNAPTSGPKSLEDIIKEQVESIRR
jgi:hypothetical protein